MACCEIDIDSYIITVFSDNIDRLLLSISVMLLQEYGITRDEKLLIGQCICTPLLRKILADFQRNAEEEEESTRLDSRWVQHLMLNLGC